MKVEEEIQEDADLEQAKEVENWGVRIPSSGGEVCIEAIKIQ